MSTARSLRKEYPLRRQESTLNKKSSKKKDGTLQKIGDFFQSSPTIIHSKGLYSINNTYSLFSGHCRMSEKKRLSWLGGPHNSKTWVKCEV